MEGGGGSGGPAAQGFLSRLLGWGSRREGESGERRWQLFGGVWVGLEKGEIEVGAGVLAAGEVRRIGAERNCRRGLRLWWGGDEGSVGESVYVREGDDQGAAQGSTESAVRLCFGGRSSEAHHLCTSWE